LDRYTGVKYIGKVGFVGDGEGKREGEVNPHEMADPFDPLIKSKNSC